MANDSLFRVTALGLTGLLSWTACDPGDASGGNDGGGGKADDVDGEGVACTQAATYPSTVLADALADQPGALDETGAVRVSNYTAWPVYDPFSDTAIIDDQVTRRIDDPTEARQNIAARFGECAAGIESHIQTKKPNVYIYFTGFGGADQNNSLVGEGAILKWINDRDPNALIFSINWNCDATQDPFCAGNTDAIAVRPESPAASTMTRAIDVIVPQIASAELAETLKSQIGAIGLQQRGYDSALSHSMWLAARLIDQLIVAGEGEGGASLIGDIHIAGYSMGAHAAAQLLVQDFSEDGSGGYAWSRSACSDGSGKCTVANLAKVKWSLAMGLSGWSDALQRHNGFDAAGKPSRNPQDRALHENGGLLRVADPAYAGKLAVLNRRMDPTGNADDTYQRGFLDIFFADYNHYAHDYALPLFIDDGFVRMLDAFLENPGTTNVDEIGIVYDNAGRIDFDDCPPGASCDATTGYVVHASNRSHGQLDVPVVAVETVDGVEHPEKSTHRAATFSASGAAPLAIRTFEQEDLRGAVELQLRPRFDVAAQGVQGLFSYGTCGGSSDELMPQAFIENGQLVFEMTYQGQPYRATVDAAGAGLQNGQWSHLAFSWELPVESLTVAHDTAADLAAALPNMLGDLAKHQIALVLATGLRKPLATTYKRQAGEGTLRIHVNGELAVEAPLGTPDSQRECLAAADVLVDAPYDVNGELYPSFNPYAGYDRANGDFVGFTRAQPIGSKCKAYRVRNTLVNFGCARSEGVNLAGDMDDITLIWGPGREDFLDIDHETGEPVLWPIGVDYDANALKL